MLRRDFFIQALKARAHLKRDWVNSAFAKIVEDPNIWESDPYPYRIVHTPEGHIGLVPDEEGELVPTEIVDGFAGQPLYRWLDAFTLQPGETANHPSGDPIDTTYGNVFVNDLMLSIPLGAEIPFQTGHVNIGHIESLIEKRLVDDPEEDDGDSPSPPGKIYVREYVEFCDHALSLVGYNQITVQSSSRKALGFHPDARATRDALKEKYKGRLSDPVVIAQIGQELEKLDKEWLKGDPTEGFFGVNEGKYYGKVRKRLYYMFGGEAPFSEGTVMEFIERSLEEGIVPEALPVIINSLRQGIYNRGAQTQLGGEATKTIYRMLGTSRITEEDCGTTVGVPFPITEENHTDYVGFYQMKGTTLHLLDTESLKAAIGTSVTLRSPLTCKTEGRNVCKCCVGIALGELSEGLTATAAQVSGKMMSAFLAAMHSKELKTKRVNLNHWLR